MNIKEDINKWRDMYLKTHVHVFRRFNIINMSVLGIPTQSQSRSHQVTL